ncbi:MAG: endonuclease/exonuclease/phosphatase family protein [Micromonosporaceae bacterium]|nr:endonuclease/exonuclease/phosphatase family protein [Micromonosporaceae bacterium]
MRSPLARVTLGAAILIDVLRVFLPSLITIFGSAGSTPAELIGVYALVWFLAAFLAVPAARLVRPGIVAVAGAVLLAAGRVALQATDGGSPQLYVASVALLGGLWWLAGTAMAAPGALLPGVVWGLAVATGLHAALDTVDLMWRGGAGPVVLVVLEAAAFVALLAWRSSTVESSSATADSPAPAPRALLAIGPAILLWNLYPGSPAHAQAADGWAPVPAALAVVVAGFLATALAARPRWTGHPIVPGVVLVASAAGFAFGAATIDGVHGVAPWWTVVVQLVGALALGACLGWAATLTAAADRPYRRGLLAATGLLLFMLFAFAYYAAYDLGVPNDYVPILVALVIAVLAAVGVRRGQTVRSVRPVLAALAGAVAAAVAVALVPVWRPASVAPEPPAEGLRIAAYNIRMGFGVAGTLTLREQAEVLRELRPHVIALSEVDRAWFLNGGHDDLRLIAESLGLRMIWAPAADEVWGDALLTNLPVTSVRNHVLVRGGPTGAQALEVGLRWAGRDITVIATHLQPPSGWEPLDQVEQLADIVRSAPKPVVVVGDLNLEPGEPAWDVLRAAGLVDAFAGDRPFVTIPSIRDEDSQIDHILTTPGFRYVDPANPDVPHSDHRPVAVTLIPTA